MTIDEFLKSVRKGERERASIEEIKKNNFDNNYTANIKTINETFNLAFVTFERNGFEPKIKHKGGYFGVNNSFNVTRNGSYIQYVIYQNEDIHKFCFEISYDIQDEIIKHTDILENDKITSELLNEIIIRYSSEWIISNIVVPLD